MKALIWPLLFLCLGCFWGCDRQDNTAVQPLTSDIITGKWKLTNPATNFTITLQIIEKGNEGGVVQYQLTGLSPINQYGAVATVQAEGLVAIDGISTTKRGGSSAEMTTETAYYNSLRQINRIELVGGKLQLHSADASWRKLVYDKEL